MRIAYWCYLVEVVWFGARTEERYHRIEGDFADWDSLQQGIKAYCDARGGDAFRLQCKGVLVRWEEVEEDPLTPSVEPTRVVNAPSPGR